jgi:hypothetical protein
MIQSQLNSQHKNTMAEKYTAAYLNYTKLAKKLRFPCLKCNFSFWTERQLKAHATIHEASSGTKETCPICRRKIANKNGMKLHLQFKHLKLLSKYGACVICSQTFYDATSLKTHIQKMHKGDLEFLQKTTGMCLGNYNNNNNNLDHLPAYTDLAVKTILKNYLL